MLHHAPTTPPRHMQSVRRARLSQKSLAPPPSVFSSLASSRPQSSIVRAAMDRGASIAVQDVLSIGSSLGEGSFGQVFEGRIRLGAASEERVVMKRVKPQVEGADDMQLMELYLTNYVSRNARNAVPRYLGCIEVSAAQATRTLTEGLWLVWRYEGSKTLQSYLRHRDCLGRLANDLGVTEVQAGPMVVQQVLECLRDLHNAGVVHRDVKPSNVIFSELDQRFKLIDLGAAADLRSGTNYIPNESILDPMYAAPERYVLPIDAPNLAQAAGPMKQLMSPMLWARHRPDRFDSYAVGLILMQLSIPYLRTDRGLRQFHEKFRQAEYDLTRWRRRHRSEVLSERDPCLLDVENGLGWEFAEAMLRPRQLYDDVGRLLGSTASMDDGAGSSSGYGSSGASSGPARLSASEAVKSKFLSKLSKMQGRLAIDKEVVARSESSRTVSERAQDLWSGMSRQLTLMQARVSELYVETEVQRGTVRLLRDQVQRGEASKRDLEEAESTLKQLENQISSLAKEMSDLSSRLGSWWKSLGGGGGGEGGSGKERARVLSSDSDELDASVFRAGNGSVEQSGTGMLISAAAVRRQQQQQQQASTPSSSSPSSSSSDGPMLAKPVGEALYASLKFTSLAARVMGGIVSSVTRDVAEKSKKEDEKRIAESQAKEFFEYLAFLTNQKIISPLDMDFDAVVETMQQKQMATNAKWLVVRDDADRRQLYDEFQAGLRERQETTRREAAYRVLLQEMLTIDASLSWVDVRTKLNEKELFLSVAERRRQPLFNEVKQSVRDAIAARDKAAKIAAMQAADEARKQQRRLQSKPPQEEEEDEKEASPPPESTVDMEALMQERDQVLKRLKDLESLLSKQQDDKP